MSETVDIPGVGATKKQYVYVGVAVVGVLAIMYFRHKSAAGSSASSTTAVGASAGSDPYPSDGTTGNPSDPFSVDPATGITYGNEQAGSSAFGAGVFDAASAGGGSTTSDQSAPGPGTFTSNAQWSQYAEQYLIQTLGLGAATVGNALGKYITGQAVTAQQESIINDAISIAGYPPVAGTGNYPPSIRVSGSKHGGKTYADNPVTGLHATVKTEVLSGRMHQHAIVTWHESNHATSYKVELKEGSKVLHTGSTDKLTYAFHNLKTKTKYEVTVLAIPAKTGTRPAVVTFETH